ncbi:MULTISPECIES: cystathionine beta-lyase [unclassified Roseitalea]|uniref:cystathionine beta-lyase n=1 Tax=unclassified Roseitalea TaxID=2639107 RepID=UPI00273D7626|nr:MULTISPECIES: cystathionine beta-lyase [unclassified Roseitalea]
MTARKRRPAAGINTTLTHAGNDPHDYHGFVNPPVVRASTVLFADARTLRHNDQRYTYGTHATPTTDALTSAIDALEGSAGTILVPSGLAAVTVPLLAFLSAGDHVLIVDTVYYPTRRFADTVLTRMGIEVEYYVPEIGEGIAGRFRDNTRVLFMEAPGSNTFQVQDVPAMATAARERGIVTMIDNTWATPLFFRPLDHGVDISIHAATKYPAGHADVLMGMTSANRACWERLSAMQTALGTCAAPDDAYQVLRGLRTMGVRLAHHQQSALTIARWLDGLRQKGHALVGDVLFPALESAPGHAIWKRDFGGAAGVFAFVLRGSKAQADAFLDALTWFGLGFSWGGYESLAVPVHLGDRTVSARDYGGQVIRLQIGLEDADDLIADIETGLAAALAAA